MCKFIYFIYYYFFLTWDLLLQLHSEGSGTALPLALKARLVSLEDRTRVLLGCPPGPGGASFLSVMLFLRLGDAQGLRLWGCPGSHSPLQAPGLLVGAQTAHSTVPGTAADTGVGEGEAADSTEGALGPGWGSRTGHQVVRTLGHTQVLLPQQGLRSLKWSPRVFFFFFPVSASSSNWGSLLPSWGRPTWGSSWKLSFSKASSCLLTRRCRATGSSTRRWPGSWERTEVFFSTISTTQLYICVNLYIKD